MEIMEIKGNIAQSLTPEPLQKTVPRPEPKKADIPPLPEVREKRASQSEEDLHALAEKMNQSLQNMRYSIKFVPDMESGKVVIKVLDEDGKVIRRIPPEIMEGLAANVGENTGLVVNETLE
jgi:uncharacterized FlaG/YvyC family protein